MLEDVDLSKHDISQVNLMNELVLVVDENDKVLRYESKKATHLVSNIEQHNLLHRAFSIFLFDEEGKLLLQKRASEKITFPDHWTNTVCSHPIFYEFEGASGEHIAKVYGTKGGEQPEIEEADQLGIRIAAVRKLKHELGIEGISPDELRFITRIHYKAPSCETWGEHEIDYILFAQKSGIQANPNPNEVSDYRFVTQDELRELIATAEEKGLRITPWFRLIVQTFIYKWWSAVLEGGPALDSHIDREKIHRLL